MRAALALFTSAVLLGQVASAESPAGDAEAAPPTGEVETRPIRTITSDEVTRYVATLKELVAVGAAADPSTAAQSPEYREKAEAALESNGFTTESFSSVHWNVSMAYAALEMQGREEEIAKAREQMEQLKSQLPPEQYEQFEQQMAMADRMIEAQKEVPPANLELVEKSRGELENLLQLKR